MPLELSRRQWLVGAPLALGAAIVPPALAAHDTKKPDAKEPWGYCLNTSTISGKKANLKLTEKFEIASRAGYQGIEPWIGDVDQYVKDGGSLKDLRKRIVDLGLKVVDAIDFPEWIVDDESRRKKGLERVKHGMDIVQQLGGQRLAAPPAGAAQQTNLDLRKAGERYRTLLELGETMGVVPQLELWGFSKTLSRLSEVLYVASESGHRQASLLLDVYHLYKGGSSFESLRLVSGDCLHVVHFNDYPATPARADIVDAQRVYPGDGVAPLKEILRTLRDIGFKGSLSLELFNPTYWMQDPLTVAKTGIDKMRALVQASLA